MAERIDFKVKLTGDLADEHRFEGYDGYMGLAGVAWTMSLVANYVETGKIRQRGDFPGRHLVQGSAPGPGSVLTELSVFLASDAAQTFGLAAATGVSGELMRQLLKRVIDRNLGEDDVIPAGPMRDLAARRGGDVEALVAVSEAPIRQAHSVIGNGAKKLTIVTGHNIINTFDEETKEYVRQNVEDSAVKNRLFSVSAFNANSGYGSVFDTELGRVVPISMSRDTLRMYRPVFSWGLDQYANRTGRKIDMTFYRILAMDGRPKRYIVQAASIIDR
ncbi:DUF7946 domain-containing protein [Brevundimonas sp.]|uniref:DUF7946 domain-containing protein n=1 Tax=Brevundimonas sp. TaxID=1871086 RepID=UPI002FCC0C81